MTNLPRLLLGLLVLCTLVPPVNAQQTAPCSDPAYRQFDFWVGKWEVFRPDGESCRYQSHRERVWRLRTS